MDKYKIANEVKFDYTINKYKSLYSKDIINTIHNWSIHDYLNDTIKDIDTFLNKLKEVFIYVSEYEGKDLYSVYDGMIKVIRMVVEYKIKNYV